MRSRGRLLITVVMLAAATTVSGSGSEIGPVAVISTPTHLADRKVPTLSRALGTRHGLVLAAREMAQPHRRARLYQAILVSWLYNFGVALAALQQQFIFNQLFSDDGSAIPTPTSALLYGYKKACDYFFTFLTVGWCGALSDRVGRRPLMAYSAGGLAIGFVMVATCNSRWPQLLLLAGCIDGLSSCMPNICQVNSVTSPSCTHAALMLRPLQYHSGPARKPVPLSCLCAGSEHRPLCRRHM
jgi:hypothetical protein